MPSFISTLSPLAKIDVFLLSSDFKIKISIAARLQRFHPVAYWFSALETCSFLSQVLLVIPGLWYLLVDTPVLWSIKTGHTINMPMFNLKESLQPWRGEMVSYLVNRSWHPVQWESVTWYAILYYDESYGKLCDGINYNIIILRIAFQVLLQELGFCGNVMQNRSNI